MIFGEQRKRECMAWCLGEPAMMQAFEEATGKRFEVDSAGLLAFLDWFERDVWGHAEYMDFCAGVVPSYFDPVDEELAALTAEWKATQPVFSSNSKDYCVMPVYQRIIGYGPRALPFILRELRRELDHWFWALRAISGEDPVAKENWGKMEIMRRTWIEWGVAKGYLPAEEPNDKP